MNNIAYLGLHEQFALAFSALIPFLLAVSSSVLVVSVIIWRMFEWRYKGVIEKTRSLYKISKEISKAEIKRAQQVYSDKEEELSNTVASLNPPIEELTARSEKQADSLPADVVAALKQLKQTAKLANVQIGTLSEANDAVDDAVDDALDTDPQEEGVPRRRRRTKASVKTEGDDAVVAPERPDTVRVLRELTG